MLKSTLDELAQELRNATQAKQNNLGILAEKKVAQLEAEHNLTVAETSVVLAGLEGSNDTLRKADLVDRTMAQREALLNAKLAVVEEQAALDRAKGRVRLVETLITIRLAQEASDG